MTEKTRLDQTKAEKKELEDDEEQNAADMEPMGSVAAAVPRDAGSAVSRDKSAAPDCEDNPAPAHEGGHATLVAGEEAHHAEQPTQQKDIKDRKH